MSRPGPPAIRAEVELLGALVRLSRGLGARASDARVLERASSLLVAVHPDRLVAKVAMQKAAMRSPWVSIDRELATAAFLASQGCPVVPPAASIDPGPHVCAGRTLGFWTLAAASSRRPTLDQAARSLRVCHDALIHYRHRGERRDPFAELVEVLPRIPEVHFHAGERRLLLHAAEKLLPALDALDSPAQVLHGDAHVGNALLSGGRCVWTDWEETFAGPREWDLACLVAPSMTAGAGGSLLGRVCSAYGGRVDRRALGVLLAVRVLHHEVWSTYVNSCSDASRSRRIARQRWLASHLSAPNGCFS